MNRPTIALCLLVFLVLAGYSQEQKEQAPPPKEPPTDLVIPPEEAKRENPVKPTESSITEGKKLYGYQCAMCHGETGDGKGEMVEPMKLKLKDYTDPAALKEWTDGMLFYILEKGRGKMPGQEGRMKADQKWNMINYIRSLSKKKEEAAKPKEPAKPGQ